MNKCLILFLSCLLLLCCNNGGFDNFYNTKRVIITNKKKYDLGDTINISLIVSPKSKEKNIRLYKNFKNISFYFSTSNGEYKTFTKNKSDDLLKDTTYFNLKITRDAPLKLDFQGKTYLSNDSLVVEFEEINYIVKFDRKILNKNQNSKIKIHGICLPIHPEFGASIEEYFETTEIEINK